MMQHPSLLYASARSSDTPEQRMGDRETDWLLAMTDPLLREAALRTSSEQEVLQAITRLVHTATHDALTGLPARGLLIGCLERELARAAVEPEETSKAVSRDVAVLFIDLDNFKLVNDSLGHQSGDELLSEMARRIRACVAEGDLVSRFGGDEIVILHPRARQGSEEVLGARVLRAMAEPVQVAGREVVTSASIGVALCAPGALTAEQLLRNADMALHAAKSRGRGRMERFNDELHQRASQRLLMESDLRIALRDGQLCVHYQPQVNLATGRLVGVEALARWQHPVLGWVPPAEFIPIAEHCGLIHEVGRQVLQSACVQLAQWAAMGSALSMTVNLSPRQLDDPGFIDELRQIVLRTGVRPSSLCLELTEGALMNSQTDIAALLERIHRMGVYLAIDDFGTGHSSLARLRDLPVEVLKIDRSFVDGLPVEPGDTAIVSSILSLAFAMGRHIIAEGVERMEQAIALRNMGCLVAQGYLFSAPVAPASITPMLTNPPWQPPSGWRARSGKAPAQTHARKAHRTFTEEFLDHIGAPMWTPQERKT